MISTHITNMASSAVCLLSVLLLGLSVAFPTTTTTTNRSDAPAETLPPTTERTPPKSLSVAGAHCPTSLPNGCHCQDTNARVYVVCNRLTLTDLMELKLGDGGSIWLRISDSRFATLGPRAITTLRVEGLQINSSNISQVHQHAFVDIGHLKSLALQDNLLTDIPVEALRRLPALEMVSLAGNSIEKVTVNAFTDMPNLYYISLSQNRISSIEAGCFGPTVRQLALSSNYLTSLNNSVRSLPRLEWLLLTENRLSTLKGQLVHLQSLTHLHVADNNLTDLSDTFSHLKHLKALNLSQNSISTVGESDFASLAILTMLDLSSNVISEVAPKAFLHMKHLAFLDISDNVLTNVNHILEPIARSLMRLFLCDNQLVTFDVTLPALRYLDLSRNRLTSVFGMNQVLGSGKHFNRLEQLILSDNQLENLHENFRHLTPSLVYLYLDRNRFTNLDKPLGGEAGYWKRLVGLNLSGNAIENVSARALHGLVTLMELDLSRNRISRLELGCFSHLSVLQSLDLGHNLLEYVDLGLLDGLHDLGELNLAHNQITGVNRMAFEGLISLVHLDLSNNRLISLRYFLSPLFKLNTLNVSLNALPELDGADLAELKELKVLQASNNRVAAIGIRQQLNLPHLTTLNLDNNQLLSLDSLSLEQLPNLHQLDLTNNFLSRLDQDTFARNWRLHRLQIQGNPWVCDNNFIDILLGLEAKNVQIDDKNWCINSVVPADFANVI